MKAYERLIKYSKYPTASNEDNQCCPSTNGQLEFATDLKKELIALGLEDVELDENGYLFATIPATSGFEDVKTIGFIAHMDVSPDVEDNGVNAKHILYTGGDILLNEEKNIIMKVSDYPVLEKYIGTHLIVTDGTTLLGADDKAGIAEIITAAEILLADKSIPHGKIRIGFTPDEEVGRGADLFDVSKFGASYAYTVDGSFFGEVEYETFNAASLKVSIKGVSTHPGAAKNTMVNASIVATEFISMLPNLERPEHTEGYEGFYHLTEMNGSIEAAHLNFILRDHDIDKLEMRKEYSRRVSNEINKKYGEGTCKIEICDSYRNMKEMVLPEKHLIDNAYKAIENLGGKPVSYAVRGGTDGSRLSFMGLPCPNLGTGSHNHHGRFEFACEEEMDKCVMQIIEIAKIYSR